MGQTIATRSIQLSRSHISRFQHSNFTPDGHCIALCCCTSGTKNKGMFFPNSVRAEHVLAQHCSFRVRKESNTAPFHKWSFGVLASKLWSWNCWLWGQQVHESGWVQSLIHVVIKYIQKEWHCDKHYIDICYFKGIEDKLIATGGYCIVITDEGMGFLDDIKKKERQHESDLSMLNQFFDGRGDKTTLAQNRERSVPRNSTSISVSLQPESFFSSVTSLGKTLWQDNGFGERFIMSAIRPYK